MLDLKRGYLFFVFLALFVSGSNPIGAKAAAIQSFDSNSSIGFYGEYVFENEPEPTPPSGPQEESPMINDDESVEIGDLPQLNQLGYRGWPWLGLALIILAWIKACQNREVGEER